MNFDYIATKIRPASEQAKTNLIVKAYAGSIAYGTNIATSDTDFRGIFHADPIHYLTPFFPFDEFKDTTEEDTTVYELDKYMKLYLDGNPNILELLWTDPKDVVFRTPIYDTLVKHAPYLLSSKVAFTFTGYAAAQLKRIRGHNKWINKPATVEPPRQTKYISMVHNFTDNKIFKVDIEDYRDGYRLIPYDGNLFGLYEMPGYQTFDELFTLNTVYDAEEHLFTEDGHRRMPLFIMKYNKEEYNRDKDEWQNYWNWKNNRNEKRSELEEAHGYDTKHAMHLVRLMRMGAEILEGKGVLVKRPDAKELLEIRNGKLTYDELIKYAEEMDEYIRSDLYTTTLLPKKPDVRLAASLLIKLKTDIIG